MAIDSPHRRVRARRGQQRGAQVVAHSHAECDGCTAVIAELDRAYDTMREQAEEIASLLKEVRATYG